MHCLQQQTAYFCHSMICILLRMKNCPTTCLVLCLQACFNPNDTVCTKDGQIACQGQP